MKLTMCVAALASLGFVVSASHMATGPPSPVKGHKHLVFWDPENAYEHDSQMKGHWEEICEQALHRAGCGVGVIHKGQIILTQPHGQTNTYMKVEGAPLTNMEDVKKMRVFDDGSFQDGWSAEDRKFISELKNPKDRGAPAKDRTARIYWDPADAYMARPIKKPLWEGLCDEVLTREGCGYGVIHKGENKVTKANGEQTSYVHVEGRPSEDVGPVKKMRVFREGFAESVSHWSWSDHRAMTLAKRPSRKYMRKQRDAGKPVPRKQSHGAHLVWDPADAYMVFPERRSKWEQKCDESLVREGCGYGVIHKGENTLTKPNGEKASYVHVEGKPSVDEGRMKRMLVFDDGSSQLVPDWSGWHRRMISQAKRSSKPHLPQHKDVQMKPPRARLVWDPADAYHARPWKKSFWEQRCDEALQKEECVAGIIHKGESVFTKPDGEKTSYLNVEGWPSTDMEHSGHRKRMRVFKDGSSEDFTKDGWTAADQGSIARAKQPRGVERPWSERRPQWEAIASTQEHAQAPFQAQCFLEPSRRARKEPIFEKPIRRSLSESPCERRVRFRRDPAGLLL